MVSKLPDPPEVGEKIVITKCATVTKIKRRTFFGKRKVRFCAVDSEGRTYKLTYAEAAQAREEWETRDDFDRMIDPDDPLAFDL